jgi:ribulose-phosphate 3-epimerase
VSRAPLIVPSVLTADFAQLGRDCRELEAAGADRIQWDVMDGQFVPNLTFGPDVIAACRTVCALPFEAHLQCNRPEELLPRYVDAGCDLLLVHPETLRQPHRTYARIRELGARVGVALAPGTPLTVIEDALDAIDVLLVLTVNPGFGGQPYLRSMEAKIARARARIDGHEAPVELEVDGGIASSTIAGARAAGADTFVVGTAMWRYPSFAEGIGDLRRRAAAERLK